jgi:hypothetical protein
MIEVALLMLAGIAKRRRQRGLGNNQRYTVSNTGPSDKEQGWHLKSFGASWNGVSRLPARTAGILTISKRWSST